VSTFKELVDKLTQFPHIQTKLNWVWGSRECRQFLSSLTTADRLNRKGFPFEVVMVIDDLIILHDNVYPQFKPKPSLWDN
jgi:hypothetical protein